MPSGLACQNTYVILVNIWVYANFVAGICSTDNIAVVTNNDALVVNVFVSVVTDFVTGVIFGDYPAVGTDDDTFIVNVFVTIIADFHTRPIVHCVSVHTCA